MELRQHATGKTRTRHKTHGFSLIEGALTLLILGILAAAGLPSWRSMTQRHQELATSGQLSAFLASARSTAITFRKRTVVCPWDGDMGCRDDSDWTRGWLMFYDADGNRRPDLPDDVLRTEIPPDSPTLSVHSSQWRPRAVFMPSGAAPGSNLTLSICRQDQAQRLIILNAGGRPRVESAPAGSACPA